MHANSELSDRHVDLCNGPRRLGRLYNPKVLALRMRLARWAGAVFHMVHRRDRNARGRSALGTRRARVEASKISVRNFRCDHAAGDG